MFPCASSQRGSDVGCRPSGCIKCARRWAHKRAFSSFCAGTTLASQLEAVGIAPSDIEYFSISHSHFDHVGNAGLFAENSTFLIDSDERVYMFRDEAREDELFALVAPLETANTIEFEGDYDVFGDGSVVIIATPGHTPGHTSLLVNLSGDESILLSGDLYTTC